VAQPGDRFSGLGAFRRRLRAARDGRRFPRSLGARHRTGAGGAHLDCAVVHAPRASTAGGGPGSSGRAVLGNPCVDAAVAQRTRFGCGRRSRRGEPGARRSAPADRERLERVRLYTGVVVATLGALSAGGVLLVALLLGDITVGAQNASIVLQLPTQMGAIVSSALLLTVVAFLAARRYRIVFPRFGQRTPGLPESRPADPGSADVRAANSGSADVRPSDPGPADVRPADANPAASIPPDERQRSGTDTP
jgi:hypothetical protein